MNYFRILSVFTILVLGFSGCASSKPIESLDKKVTNDSIDELISKRETNVLPVSGCCNLNQNYMGIVVLDKICLSPTQTKLILHLTKKKKVCVLKENMIFQDNNGNRYDLVSTVGVDLCPKRREMVDTPFSLVFPRMKEDLESFDLIESETAKYAHNPWSFKEVDVLSCKWQ